MGKIFRWSPRLTTDALEGRWVSIDAVKQVLKEAHPERAFSKEKITSVTGQLNAILEVYKARLADNAEPNAIQLSERVNNLHDAPRCLSLALPYLNQRSLRNY